MKGSCHICSGDLSTIDNYNSLYQVTSDCREWSSNTKLAICTDCCTIQKVITNCWISESESIYKNYTVYSQSCGSEQVCFEASAQFPRSIKYIKYLESFVNLSSTASLLDFGCGNGSFLLQFNKAFPSWNLCGFDINEEYRQSIDSISSNSRFISSISDINYDSFKVITLIHSLEHIVNPLLFLTKLYHNMKVDSLLFIQVPNVLSSPFDILIADHCTHFTNATLSNLVLQAGFSIVHSSTSNISKEISLIASKSSRDSSQSMRQPYPNNQLLSEQRNLLQSHLTLHSSIFEHVASLNSLFGIFGSSISSSWLRSRFPQSQFFVDEDLSKVGNYHLNLPIYSVSEAPTDIPIVLPFATNTARSIFGRLSSYLPNLSL